MSLFEYVSIAYSLLFSFAAVRLLAGVPHAIAASRRYSIHLYYVFVTVFATAALFRAQWSARDVEWTFPAFLMHFAGPAMIYFLACPLIPDEPSSVESWERYFFSVWNRYFGGLCVWAFVMVVNSTFILGTPIRHPVRFVQLGVLVLGVAGLASENPSTHRVILICAPLVGALAGYATLQPGALAAKEGVQLTRHSAFHSRPAQSARPMLVHNI